MQVGISILLRQLTDYFILHTSGSFTWRFFLVSWLYEQMFLNEANIFAKYSAPSNLILIPVIIQERYVFSLKEHRELHW